jgi:hypothetical protein
MAYEKTKAAIEKLNAQRRKLRPPGATVITYYKGYYAERDGYYYEMAEAYHEEAGVPFIDAWRMRNDIESIIRIGA